MAKNLFIFGNGLGRALENNFFQIEPAMRAAWDDKECLTEVQRDLISRCISKATGESREPRAEHELEPLYDVLEACETIAEFETVDVRGGAWLTEHGVQFPQAIRKYIHRVSRYFHEREEIGFDDRDYLPESFSAPLYDAACNIGINVATLNYDDLLYNIFTETPVFGEYKLRDCFFRDGFDYDRAQKKHNEPWGWFLHLHGSPLYQSHPGRVPTKMTRWDLKKFEGGPTNHVILANVENKAKLIDSSEILRAYWLRFRSTVSAANNIVLFGYSGEDLHLNDVIETSAGDARIRVVEWSGAGEIGARNIYWTSALGGKNVEVIPLDDILQFTDWVP